MAKTKGRRKERRGKKKGRREGIEKEERKEEKTKEEKGGECKENNRRVVNMEWRKRSSKVRREGENIGTKTFLQVDSYL